jgi:carotenoid cleavage dioxygenase
MTSAEQISASDDLAVEDNPFLQGNYAPVPEETSVQDLEVEGTIPEEIEGHLLRDGPNPIDPGPNHHWFVGDGMLHGIEFRGGRALSYRNRWIRTDAVQELKGLTAAPSNGVELLVQGSGNVNVIQHAGRVLALSELGFPYEVTRDLDTLRMYDFDGALGSHMTAHPKIDRHTGEMIFFGYDFTDVHLRYHVADADGKLSRSFEIATPVSTMMHDFGATATRTIFMDFPVIFDPEMVASRSIPYRWSNEHPARLGILPRHAESDVTQWIEIDPCFVFHPLNCYDDGDRIVMDVVKHQRTFDGGDLDMSELHPPRLVRWTIDPKAEKVSEEIIDDTGMEFPRVNPWNECHPHQFGYAVKTVNSDAGTFDFGNLAQYDLRSGQMKIQDVGARRSAGEGVFVPRSNTAEAAEDDGWVLACVYDADTNKSDVIVIDAQDFSAPPVARIKLPTRVPFGFHGNFVTAG